VSSLVWPTFAGLKIEQTREAIPNTLLPTSITRVETPFSWESYCRYRYRLDIEVLRSDSSLSARTQEWQKLVGFHARMRGSLDTFLFTDDEDSSVTAHYFGVGNGVATDFQLQRTLVADADLGTPSGRSYWPALGDGYEPVFELNGNPSIFKDTGSGPVLQTLAVNYTLPGNGVVHWLATPAVNALLSWTGSYYYRVRFENDALPATRIVSKMWSASLSLLTVKLSDPGSQAVTIPQPQEETPIGTINGTTGSDGNATFTLRKTPIAGLPVIGFRNGVKMTNTSDFTVSGFTITALAPNIPITGDSYVFVYFA
jgi:hypothetical protein